MPPLHHGPGECLSGVCVSIESSCEHSSPIGMAGFEPAFSCSQGRRIARLSHIPACRRFHSPTFVSESGRPDFEPAISSSPSLRFHQAFPRPVCQIAREGVEPSSPP